VVALTGLVVRIVQLITDDPDAARCPGCQVRSTSGKDWVLTRPHDLPSGGGPVAVQWRKRRWRCRTEVCPRASFTEQVAQVPAGMRTTTRLRTALAVAVAVEDGRDQSELGPQHPSRLRIGQLDRAMVVRSAAMVTGAGVGSIALPMPPMTTKPTKVPRVIFAQRFMSGFSILVASRNGCHAGGSVG
jgi:hypothetical protein